MIDVKTAIRTAYVQALSGLVYNGQPITVTDELSPLDGASNPYVIVAAQTGSEENTQISWGSVELINLDVIFKTPSRAAKKPVDDVCGLILATLLPMPGTTNLPAQEGVQINCVRLSEDRTIPVLLNGSNSVVRRVLTFKQHVLQK